LYYLHSSFYSESLFIEYYAFPHFFRMNVGMLPMLREATTGPICIPHVTPYMASMSHLISSSVFILKGRGLLAGSNI
jgi:hypothetical protein